MNVAEKANRLLLCFCLGGWALMSVARTMGSIARWRMRRVGRQARRAMMATCRGLSGVVRWAGALHGASSVRAFGSRVRGDARPDSDLDLLVKTDPDRSLLDLIAIEQDLEDLLRCKVDVVSENGLSPYIRDHVLAEALLLIA